MSDTYNKYVQSWMPRDKSLLPFYLGIDSVLETLIDVDDKSDLEEYSSKIIADPLLGYIHLNPLEVAILDTKLFQRLRKIRQLGLAYLVFPSLGYSRFEHSIGVLGRLDQMLNKLLENDKRISNTDNLSSIVAKYLPSIRLAALLHDIGHCLFSHCSERVIANCPGGDTYPSAKEIQQIFSTHFQKENNIPIAEVLTLSIIGSRRFLDFLDSLNYSNKKEIEKKIKICSRFIIGLPIEDDPSSIFLSQLISSGLDADKIDYMMREQQYSGINLEIDLDRILSKLRVFSLKPYQLPFQLSHLKKIYNSELDVMVLGFEKGGQFAFEEFCIARLALHVKIYLHQKVRAAESQLSKYLNLLCESPVLKQLHNWLKVSESIVEYPELINQRFSSEGNLFETFGLNQKVLQNFKNIDQRNIVHRAFAFGPINSYSEGVGVDDDNSPSAFEKYFDEFSLANLRDRIIAECESIGDEYNISFKHDLLNEIIVDIPRLLNIQQGQETLHFERANYLPVRWTIPIDKIIIYFQENRALAYIFCPPEITDFVAAVSEIVLFKISQKVFSEENYISKKTILGFNKIKNDLTEKGFYNKYPQVKPVSKYLKTAAASERVNKIHDNLKGFKSFNNEYITISRITTFVNQFPEELQECCLCLLEHLRIYNENLLAQELEKLLEKLISNGNSVAICPLGSATDSGSRLSYSMRHVFEKFRIDKFEFNDNVILESDKLVIYDDNINSGLQLVNLLAELLDEKHKLSPDLILNENHHWKLRSADAKLKLKDMPIYFVYIVGFEHIESQIKEILSAQLGFNPSNIHIRVNQSLKESQKILTGTDSVFDHEKKRILKESLMEIGEKLLRNENKKEEKIATCKLGYADAQATVLFPYNIPTMTITAFWCKGFVDGIPWIPLAERRRRSDKSGKYIGED